MGWGRIAACVGWRVWYHPLLKAAVGHGTVIEDEVKKSLPQAGMTAAITAGSTHRPAAVIRFVSRKSEMHSDDKLTRFYQVGAAALLLAVIALQVGVLLRAPAKSSRRSVTCGSVVV